MSQSDDKKDGNDTELEDSDLEPVAGGYIVIDPISPTWPPTTPPILPLPRPTPWPVPGPWRKDVE